jgi:nicotinate-nucleotide adenylyltransferase
MTLPVSFPPYGAGQRIGLFGGSFNPPHKGHVHVSLAALKRLKLDQVWWLVSPGNPLKSQGNLAPLAERMEAAHALTHHPHLRITDLEQRLKTRYTVETLHQILKRCPDAHFVWIMGADNLKNFHRWKGWRRIAQFMPIAVIDRYGATHQAPRSKAGNALARFRIREREAGRLASCQTPAWVFLHAPRLIVSSTQLRQQHNL